MNSRRRLEQENDPVLRRATEWALEMQDPAARLERVAQWQVWLAADERHREAFARVEALMGMAERIRTVPWATERALQTDGYDPAVSVSEWKQSAHTRNKRRRSRMWYAVAASATLMVGTLLYGYSHTFYVPGLLAYKRIETPPGGMLKFMLADGSAVEVGGQSALRTLLTPGARAIALERGEAFFRVAQDAQRPFTVYSGSIAITAIGTAFNVRRSGERVVVSVAEGAVRVDAAGRDTTQIGAGRKVLAGQQLSIEPREAQLTVASIETSAVAGWRSGRMRYLDEPLSSVIGDVARYTGREIELAEPSIGELRITGTVLERNLDGWLGSLEETFALRAIRQADGSVRLERLPKSN